MGIERLLMLMNALNVEIPNPNKPKVFVVSQNSDYVDNCLSVVSDLRANGISAECDVTGKSLKSQMKYADKQSSEYVVVIGGNEIESRVIRIKRMSDGFTEEIALDDLKSYLKN